MMGAPPCPFFGHCKNLSSHFKALQVISSPKHGGANFVSGPQIMGAVGAGHHA